MQNERVFPDFSWFRVIALQKDPANHLKIRQKDPVSKYIWRVSIWPPMAIKHFVVIFQCNHQTGLYERHLGIWRFRLSLIWRGWGLGVVSKPTSSAEDGKGWARGWRNLRILGGWGRLEVVVDCQPTQLCWCFERLGSKEVEMMMGWEFEEGGCW